MVFGTDMGARDTCLSVHCFLQCCEGNYVECKGLFVKLFVLLCEGAC